MSDFLKYPNYITDEPAIYKQFDGGINNDPANENLEDNQLKDGVNIHYNNGVPERRLGANLFKNIIYHDLDPSIHRNIIQGVFTFVGQYNPCFIVVRDGLLYYSLLSENETYDMIQIPIEVDPTLTAYDPMNITIGLNVYDQTLDPTELSQEDWLIDHNGFIIYDSITAAEGYEDGDHTSGLSSTPTYQLILQNHKPIEGAVKEDTLYLATGTRFIKLYEVVEFGETIIKAEVVTPHTTNAWEYQNIGANYMSPFPELLTASTNELGATQLSSLKTMAHTFFDGETSTEFEAIMDYQIGYTNSDFYFKWEMKLENENFFTVFDWTQGLNIADIPHTYINVTYRGVTVDDTYAEASLPNPGDPDILYLTTDTAKYMQWNGASYDEILDYFLDVASGDNVTVRVRFADRFVDKTLPVAEWEIDSVYSETGVFMLTYLAQAGLLADYVPAPSDKFIDIHGCNKLFVDGNKIILYGSQINSGMWYKTIIDNYAYITDKNMLNFQTNKNERIVKCVPLEDYIVVFADNPHLGGTIHKVYGNGDDYDNGDGYYNPYKRTIVNITHSCDHPNSVQFVDNYIIFKYKQSIYSIDTRALANDRLQVTLLSRNIGHNNNAIAIPNIAYNTTSYEREVFSEVTEDYYALIFPNNNLRWKMYYKLSSQDRAGRVYFPWLRDETTALNIDGVFKINNLSTHVADDMLIQYTGTDYLDLEEEYEHKITVKAYDLKYPGFGKFVNSLMIAFYRGATSTLNLTVNVYNESNFKLIGENEQSWYDPVLNQVIWGNYDDYYGLNVDDTDKPALVTDVTTLENAKLGATVYTSRVFQPDLKFPCLSAYTEIKSSSPEAFSLANLTFDYTTTELPAKTLPQIYNTILRKGDE